MTKKLIFIFLFIGMTIGSYVPLLWGESVFSIASVLWSGIGGFAGIYCGYLIGRKID